MEPNLHEIVLKNILNELELIIDIKTTNYSKSMG